MSVKIEDLTPLTPAEALEHIGVYIYLWDDGGEVALHRLRWVGEGFVDEYNESFDHCALPPEAEHPTPTPTQQTRRAVLAERLPAEYFDLVLKYANDEQLDDTCEGRDDLERLFLWRETDEGVEFWDDVNQRLNGHSALPPLPGTDRPKLIFEQNFDPMKRIDGEEEDGWIEWSGGEPPVDLDTLVECEFRDCTVEEGLGSDFVWGTSDADDDILRYRVVCKDEPECHHHQWVRANAHTQFCANCNEERDTPLTEARVREIIGEYGVIIGNTMHMCRRDVDNKFIHGGG